MVGGYSTTERKWVNSVEMQQAAVDTSQPLSTLEEIGQRIRRANIAAGVLCANIAALGDRAYGPRPECGTDAREDSPQGAVGETFHALQDLDQTLAALDAATKRVLELA